MENFSIAGKREVFCRFIRKNGRIIYPKNARFFHFWVDVDAVEGEETKSRQLTMFDDEKRD